MACTGHIVPAYHRPQIELLHDELSDGLNMVSPGAHIRPDDNQHQAPVTAYGRCSGIDRAAPTVVDITRCKARHRQSLLTAVNDKRRARQRAAPIRSVKSPQPPPKGDYARLGGWNRRLRWLVLMPGDAAGLWRGTSSLRSVRQPLPRRLAPNHATPLMLPVGYVFPVSG